MDVNVCSRRVHDGYATIRSRGRPRAVYRSDSEELLKETDGPYALPRLSNFRVVPEDARQVPRWADLGRDQPLIENYGTLRVVRSHDLEEPRKVTLKTFSKRDKLGITSRNDVKHLKENNDKNYELYKRDDHQTDLCNHCEWKREGCARYDCDQRLYDAVPMEDDSKIPKIFYVGKTSLENDFANIDTSQRDVFEKSRENVENLNNYSTKDLKNNYIFQNHEDFHVQVKNDKLTSVKNEEDMKDDIIKSSKTSFKNDLENAKRFSKDRQPIYAIPQVFSKPRRERRLVIVDGNYVPSGDLYRTTVKYIEDINRNLAEIDKSYEKMKASPRTYGVINRIAKGELVSESMSGNLFGYVRKRDMAPMLPINTDIDEVIEERNEKDSRKDNKYLRRPNSKGRLPPKILPRSSSIENTSRHSTGSTTASSSKSTESLYAISESLTELPKINDFQKQDSIWSRTCQESEKSDLQNQLKSDIDRDISTRIKPEDSKSKDSSSSTDDEVSISKNRLPVTNAIRRNRFRVDQAEKLLLKKERASNEILGRISGKLEQVRSSENHLKNRQYDTLPSRKSKISSKPLHKSSEDMLDGERISRKDTTSLQRSYSSNNDIRRKESTDENLAEIQQNSFYMMDATEVILKGQLERSNYLQQQDSFLKTRHNSLESKETDGKIQSTGGFATLPRRGNLIKDHSDPLRRFSGNGPILEPLYEHAVSDPVKPRETQNVIPWWELATRKYRHRSCPSLQVNYIR